MNERENAHMRDREPGYRELIDKMVHLYWWQVILWLVVMFAAGVLAGVSLVFLFSAPT